METTRTRVVIAASLAVAGMLAALAADASDVVTVRDDGRKTVKVAVADLDGTRGPGAEAMYRRLQIAARRVCGTTGRVLSVNRAVRDCQAIALRDAVASANLPTLSAVYAARSGERRYAASDVNAVRDPD